MPVILDDIDSRAGSTVSLLRTFVGLYLRQIGGWISTRHLVALMAEAGLAPAATRNGIATLKQKGLLIAERREAAGYALNPAAIAMLERGDARIFQVRQMQADDRWALISFSVAESERAKRHKLRGRLKWLGCGTVAPGLWIAPEHLLAEIQLILDQHDTEAVIFLTDDPEVPGGFSSAVENWWSLDAVRDAYDHFLDHAHELAGAGAGAGADAAPDFKRYLWLIDSWRPVPYLDPGLPDRLLPKNWPAEQSIKLFNELEQSSREAAAATVLSITAVR